MRRKRLRRAVDLSTVMLVQISSASALKRAGLSAFLKSSMVLKFLNEPVAAIAFWGTLLSAEGQGEGEDSTGTETEKAKDGLWGLGEGVATDGQVGAESDVLARLAVIDRAACCVGRGEWDGVVGEAEDVDLEICEGVPKGGLDKGLEGRKLDDRHAGSDRQ